MTARWHILGLGWLLTCMPMLACERSDPPVGGASTKTQTSVEPTVYVVNYPLQFFVERIGGEAVEVVFPAPEDEDPAYWKPDADTIAAFQKADLILLNGASYARWVEHAILPASKVVDTSKAFKDRYIELEGAVKHAHGPEGEHAHRSVAFTTWLDPTLALQQAEAIGNRLTRMLPDRAEELARNFEALKRDLESLDTRLADLTKDGIETPLLAAHPVYQYVARRYGLNIKSLDWEPHQVPTAKQWAELDKLIQDHPANWMIWEAAPSTETIDKLRERSIRCGVFDPCGNVPSNGDYLQVMQRNIEALIPVFRPQ